jgi:hypothetical protein
LAGPSTKGFAVVHLPMRDVVAEFEAHSSRSLNDGVHRFGVQLMSQLRDEKVDPTAPGMRQ